jgi:hypothetical protein
MSFELIWEPRGVYRRHHGMVSTARRRLWWAARADTRQDDLLELWPRSAAH